jgi:diguanylate cyclase (GGDEF)-like protein
MEQRGGSTDQVSDREERLRLLELRILHEQAARQKAELLLGAVTEENRELREAAAGSDREIERRVAARTRDLTLEQTRALERAERDQLTNLPNRKRYAERLQAALDRARAENSSVALLLIDIDSFRQINDAFGHVCADALLVAIATRLQHVTRPGEFVCRIGGDEFAVIVEFDARPEAALEAAERMRATFAAPYVVGGRTISASCSIGAAVFPVQASDADDLQRFADLALHRLRSATRNGALVFTSEMLADFEAARSLETDFRLAVQSGQFDVHYQPIVEMVSGRVFAVEALARWSHPTRGTIPPDVFIPLAEETGLIRQLGKIVLARSCEQARRWLHKGYIDNFSVNLSSRQVQDETIIGDVLEALRNAGVEPSRLIVELTESLLLTDTPAVGRIIAELRAAGVRFALDDFGAGYSNLSYLRRLPLGELKIDKSFVHDVESSEGARAILEHIVGLSHRLGLSVVVEGVENSAQLAFVRSVGGDLAQGYFFSAPLTAAEMTRFIEKHRSEPLRPGFRRAS